MDAFEQAKTLFLEGIQRFGAEDLRGAEARFRAALAIMPDRVSVLTNLAATLIKLGRAEEAKTLSERAVSLDPANEQGWLNVGLCSVMAQAFGDAVAPFEKAIALSPDFVEAHVNLGITLAAMERFNEAEGCYRRALGIKPNDVDALNQLALLQNAMGQPWLAVDSARQSLLARETVEAKSLFVESIRRLPAARLGEIPDSLLLRALVVPWSRPSDLVGVCIPLIRNDPDIGECMRRAESAWPRYLPAPELFGRSSPAAIGRHPLFRALLTSTCIADLGMERFLTMARAAMLETASANATPESGAEQDLEFHSILARHCFINEYVFCLAPGELAAAEKLRAAVTNALSSNGPISELSLAAVAAYFPLSTLPHAERLANAGWSDSMESLVRQQVREPTEEREERAGIAQHGDIENTVSLQVQSLYEENPYPRWVAVSRAVRARRLDQLLGYKFPRQRFAEESNGAPTGILIAGCGTGQNSIETALCVQGANVLAIDLSLASLCYAKRKSRELGLSNIEYLQADLLTLKGLDRRFDMVESMGVLHHMADPWEGWRTLVSLVRPGGYMRLGFYSEAARRYVVRIREFIAQRGYGDTADDIRRCRQDLLILNEAGNITRLLGSADFFSTSMCRDLLFHTQEHRMTLALIDNFLRENQLEFLGFELEPAVLVEYRRRFPEDPAATNLAQWQAFESEFPDTFIGMYQFSVRKAG